MSSAFPVHTRRLGAAALAALILGLPTWAAASPEGGGSISLYYRSTIQKNSLLDKSTFGEGIGRLDLYQELPGYGRLFLSSDATRLTSSADGESNQISRFQAGLEGYSSGGWTSSVIVGDTAVRFTNLTEGFAGPFMSLLAVKPLMIPRYAPEPGRFLNTVYPDIYLRGAAVSSETERDSLLLFGGRLANPQGFLSNEMQVTDQTIYGAKWAHQWSPGSYAGVGVAQTDGLVRGEKSRTASNTILLMDGSARLAEWLRLVGEVKGNLVRAEGETAGDWALKAGPIVQWKRGHAELNYRRVCPDFIFVRENLQTERDLEGVFGSLDYHPIDDLALYTSFDWSRSNLGSNPTLPAVNSLAALAGGYYSRPGLPSLNVRFTATDRSSRPGSVTNIDNRSYSAYLETIYRIAAVTPYLRLQGDLFRDGVSPDASGTAETEVAGVRTFLFGTLGAYLEGEHQIRSLDSGTRTESLRARGGIALSPVSQLELSGDAEFDRDKETPTNAIRQSLTVSGRAMLTLPSRWYLSGDLRYSFANTTGSSTSEATTTLFTVGLTKRFGWGERGVSPLGTAAGKARLSEVGNIEGVVYQDLNRNGTRDAGEPGMAGVAIFLEDNSKAITDPTGHYEFRNVSAGIHQVRISERELDANLNLLVSANRRVEVATRETAAVDFSLLRAGTLRGRVLVDANGNGTADQEDTPLADVLVFLDGTPLNTFTDADGNFAFENLLPGDYLLKLDETNLPADAKALSPAAITVTVKSGRETGDITFLVGIEQKKVIRKKFGGAGRSN